MVDGELEGEDGRIWVVHDWGRDSLSAEDVRERGLLLCCGSGAGHKEFEFDTSSVHTLTLTKGG